jgi:radical SAM protein with 4Fe4S-binding SPASM domain
MFVIPFWSYRYIDSHCLITNWLTKKNKVFGSEIIALLESVYRGDFSADDPVSKELLAEACSLQVVFESKGSAVAWYEQIEQENLLKFPIVEQIELTNRCPYSCKMCPRTLSMDRQLGNMSLDLFESIIRQISNRQSYLGLHHFGESLIYSELPEAVDIARRYGIQSGLSCNPPNLRPELGKRLLEAGISNIIMSLDSLDPEVYREIRGKAARFDVADANIREFMKFRNEGEYQTFVTLQMINMYCNKAEAKRFIEYCRELEVDRGLVIRLGRWDFDDEYVESLGEFTSPGYTAYCMRPWDSVVVLWDGRVVPCCHDYNGAVVIGDLNKQSLEEIWQSDAAVKFRDENYDNAFCRKCAFSRWYRDNQREHLGFIDFHRELNESNNRQEWINPNLRVNVDGRHMFDGFDILT